jgi:hypothetical protein
VYLHTFLFNLATYSGLLPLIFFLLRVEYLKARKEVMIIVLLLACSAFVDLSSVWVFKSLTTIFFVQNCYCLVETTMLIWFFNFYLAKHIGRYTYLFVLLAFFVSWVILNQKVDFVAFENKSLALEVALVVASSFLFFYFQLKDPKTLYIYKTHRFWFATAFLVNLTGILFFFLYLPELNKSQVKTYQMLNFLFLILRNVFLSIGMFITEEKDETLASNNLLA